MTHRQARHVHVVLTSVRMRIMGKRVTLFSRALVSSRQKPRCSCVSKSLPTASSAVSPFCWARVQYSLLPYPSSYLCSSMRAAMPRMAKA